MILEDWLSLEDCDTICSAARSGNSTASQVSDQSRRSIDRDLRRSHEFDLTPEIEALLGPPIARLPNRVPGTSVVLQYDRFRILRYTTGDLFRPHKDSALGYSIPRHIQRRILTVVCALNDPSQYGGGDLVLHRCLGSATVSTPYKMPVGTALYFGSGTLHEVRPVTYGQRFSLVGWGLAP